MKIIPGKRPKHVSKYRFEVLSGSFNFPFESLRLAENNFYNILPVVNINKSKTGLRPAY